jgi:hypothetical protein
MKAELVTFVYKFKTEAPDIETFTSDPLTMWRYLKTHVNMQTLLPGHMIRTEPDRVYFTITEYLKEFDETGNFISDSRAPERTGDDAGHEDNQDPSFPAP